MKSFKLLLAILGVLTILTISVAPSSAAPPTPVVTDERIVSLNPSSPKLPAVAVGNGQVHLAWSEPGAAKYAFRGEETLDAFTIQTPGSVGNNSTYFNADVAVGGDGKIHAAWISGGSTIQYANKQPGQDWPAPQNVALFEDFANGLSLTVSGSNVFISWRHQGEDPNGYIRFVYSNNGGVSWPIKLDVPLPSGTYAGVPYLAAGRNNGPVFLAWTGNDGRVYVGQWNGSNFAPVCVSCFRADLPQDLFNPTVAVAPNGQPVAAWRSVSQGVMYASRQQDGSWGISKQFPEPDVTGPVSIQVDGAGNIHLAWVSKATGSLTTRYAVKASTEQGFSNPITVSNDGGAFKTNVDMAVCAKSGYSLAHIAWESFSNGQFIRYSRVQANGIGFSAGMMDETVEGRSLAPLGHLDPWVYLPMITKAPPPPPPPPTC
ncbi:MAG TPA: hypothetical protein VFZ66_12155 [Herpetosiphonaceae bacterium]